MSIRTKLNSFLGSLAGRLLSIFGKPPAKPAASDFKKMEFETSTQHLGVRFTEKIRRIFRFKWIKKL
ncbi:MAG: hypothetical protein WC476_10775 [Phycisphaerae bacterium]|jgi:hypothetical protein